MKPNMKQIARAAAEWPTVAQAAQEYATTYRTLRQAIERGEIESIRLGHTRVNPESVERWLAARYTPGE
jgi:excisionase family DNA binding protein